MLAYYCDIIEMTSETPLSMTTSLATNNYPICTCRYFNITVEAAQEFYKLLMADVTELLQQTKTNQVSVSVDIHATLHMDLDSCIIETLFDIHRQG